MGFSMDGLLGFKEIVFSGEIISGLDQRIHDLHANRVCHICDG